MTNLGNKDVFAKKIKKYMQLNGKYKAERFCRYVYKNI